MFKEGIEPKWEHPKNEQGGKWLVQIKVLFIFQFSAVTDRSLQPSQRGTSLNNLWLWAVLGCVGADFDDDPQIVGLVVSIRKQMDKVLFDDVHLNEMEI